MNKQAILPVTLIFGIAVLGAVVIQSRWRDSQLRRNANTESVTNGTTVLLFPEWKTSDSAFERKVHTNYYAVYRDGSWFVRERQDDGSLAIFWKSDAACGSIDAAKQTFGMNIEWNVYKGLFDALTVTNRPSVTATDVAFTNRITSVGQIQIVPEPEPELPPGYKMMVNPLGEYTFSDAKGNLYGGEFSTRQSAASQAWFNKRHKETESQRNKWEECK